MAKTASYALSPGGLQARGRNITVESPEDRGAIVAMGIDGLFRGDERQRLNRVPTEIDEEDLVRFFSLTKQDRILIA